MTKRRDGFGRRLALTLIVFLTVLTSVCLLVQKVGSASGTAERELVRDAVRSCVLTCYAVEGAYPMELDYLKDHYGLMYDEDTYHVIYDAFASNIMPSIQVLERGGSDE